ncbi:amino acid permease [Aminipila sp.]|uniref:amino acid permease n=1 Tax=Aminipila sp. TaxID=2060095 RepID=UPI00289A6944|nr:amino acid permease [Aminipila sp.]
MEKGVKGMSAWQLTMLALGTVVGGSFFVGSSVAIHAAGPSVVIAYILGGVLVYFVLIALSELTVANPDSGSFRTFATQAFGEGTGFVVGWVYWTGMVLAMSSESTAVSILVSKWIPDISIQVLGSIIIIGVTLLNLLGADKLSKLEGALAAVKLVAIASFIVIAFLLISGVAIGNAPIGIGNLAKEPFMPGGIRGIAGSMLIVMFAYAGFEIIGLAASETDEPRKTVPKAINYTVLCLVGFYILTVSLILPLIPTNSINEDVSPMVAALNNQGLGWGSTALNLVMITAIISTMLAAMFGIGRMMRSLVDEGHAPRILKDTTDVPYRGIFFSGVAMLIGLAIGFIFPKVYIFLISSGGFALLFTYTVIIASHLRLRKKNGCPPEGKCQMHGFPYTSWITLISMVIIIFSMPFIPDQVSGLITGITMIILYSVVYLAAKFIINRPKRRTIITTKN